MYPNTMSKLPSAIRSQPSKTGTTFWPNVCWICVLAAPDAITINASTNAATGQRLMCLAAIARGLLLARATGLLRSARGDRRLELLFGEVVIREPDTRHIVDGPLAIAHPIPWIGIQP